MSIKITEKDKKYLAEILSKSINGIDNVYKFEGYVVGMICSDDTVMPSAFIEEIFGHPDDDESMVWDSLEEVEQFVELYTKLNNKSVTKLQSNIYRPIFAKTKDQLSDYAYGFRRVYDPRHIGKNIKEIDLAFMIICTVYEVDQELCKEDDGYLELSEAIIDKPLALLSQSVQVLNAFRLENYIVPHDIKSNLFDSEDMDDSYH